MDIAYAKVRRWKKLVEDVEGWNEGMTTDQFQVYLNPDGTMTMGVKKPKGPNAGKEYEEVYGTASSHTSTPLVNPQLGGDPYAEGLTPEMIEEQNKRLEMVETETSVAGVIAQAVRESKPDSEEWKEWMDVLNRINKKLVEAGGEPIDPYEDRVR